MMKMMRITVRKEIMAVIKTGMLPEPLMLIIRTEVVAMARVTSLITRVSTIMTMRDRSIRTPKPVHTSSSKTCVAVSYAYSKSAKHMRFLKVVRWCLSTTCSVKKRSF